MDMTGNYRDIAWLFPNAKIIADKFHWIRQIHWPLDKVRKNAQKEFDNTKRKYFKAKKKLLFKRYSELKDEKNKRLAQCYGKAKNYIKFGC